MAEEQEKRTINLTTPILVVLLVAASFLAGSFWTKLKVSDSEEGTAETEKQAVQTSPAAQQPEIKVLGAEDLQKIEASGGAEKGNPNAPITIVEFSEYQCPYCKRYVDDAYQQIFEEYGDQVRYLFRDYPLSIHQHAKEMAEAARCAGDQGQYWQMHDRLFEKQSEWSAANEIDSLVTGYASSLGLNTSEFNACLNSDKHFQAINDDVSLGQSVGVSGTPSFFVNGRMLVGAQPFSAFKDIIDAELNK